MKNTKIKTQIELSQINKLKVTCKQNNETDTYAFYVHKDGKVIEKIMYGTSNTMVYWITEPGEYNVKVFVKNNEGEKNSEFTDSVVFEGLKPIHCSEDSKQKNISWIKNVYIILKEIWCNRMRMLRISCMITIW